MGANQSTYTDREVQRRRQQSFWACYPKMAKFTLAKFDNPEMVMPLRGYNVRSPHPTIRRQYSYLSDEQQEKLEFWKQQLNFYQLQIGLNLSGFSGDIPSATDWEMWDEKILEAIENIEIIEKGDWNVHVDGADLIPTALVL